MKAKDWEQTKTDLLRILKLTNDKIIEVIHPRSDNDRRTPKFGIRSVLNMLIYILYCKQE